MGIVSCARCGKQREAPRDIPYAGKIGDRILNSICSVCWKEWEETQIKLMNEYHVDLSEREHRTFMMNKMKEFLGLPPQ